MSFLSSHRLHWGSHHALHGHFSTELDIHVHDLPLHTADAVNGRRADAFSNDQIAPAFAPPPREDRLPDIPGP